MLILLLSCLFVGSRGLAFGTEWLLDPLQYRLVEELVTSAESGEEFDCNLMHRKVHANSFLHVRGKVPVSLEDVDNDGSQHTRDGLADANSHPSFIHLPIWKAEGIVPAIEEEAQLRENVAWEDSRTMGFLDVEAQSAGAETSLVGGFGALASDTRICLLGKVLEVHGIVLPVHVKHATVRSRQNCSGRVPPNAIVVSIHVKGWADNHFHDA